ncbi:BQ5605_C002g01231 [Microbotryum silenes-dioicae]|uniref:BQ5605_C002g01231 protein n=1 Tax=Microbotryum silenes-dioicae TaxID=796604 RepID=A0A2X0M228_9BASI|nr:BQ5605_C002g01231 [Microbotryum silenes-dioicae]
MDDIKCNSLKCRKSLQLEGTSHIFCVECANSLFSVPQICPACDTALPDADDVVQTTLNPPDSYKTSVLSGLHPSIILDVASRALNFHTYQTQQEAAFQALVTRNTQEMSSIMRDANSEITLLKEKVAETERDLELERRRIRDLHETHKANAKAYNKLKAQYDKEKQRNLLPSSERHPSNTFEAAAAAIAGNTSGARQPFASIQDAGTATPARSHSSSSIISQPDRGWSASAQRNQYARNAQKLGGGDAGAGGVPFAYNPGDSVQRPRNTFQGDHTQLHNSRHAPQQRHGAAMKGLRRGTNHSTGSGSTGSDGGGKQDHFVQTFQGQNSAREAGQHKMDGTRSRAGEENLPQFLGQPLPSPRGGTGGGGQPGQKLKGGQCIGSFTCFAIPSCSNLTWPSENPSTISTLMTPKSGPAPAGAREGNA